MMTLIAQICLVAAVALFVLSPLLYLRGKRAWAEPEHEGKLRSIAERKARLYGALIELDFDRDSGKISPDDHARMHEETMTEVLTILAEEERLGLAPPRRPTVIQGGDQVERMIEEYKRRRSAKTEGRGS